MSTSSAVPVLRTPSLQTAYETALRLLDLAIPDERFHVSAQAQALTLAEARRMALAFPESTIGPDDSYRPESRDEIREMITAGDARAQAVLPVSLHIERRPVGSVEKAFFAVVGTGGATIDWAWFQWPAVSELDLEPLGKDACVQIAVNSRDVHRDIPATDHTVFIHYRSGDIERAEWLARQVGLHLVGPEEGGW